MRKRVDAEKKRLFLELHEGGLSDREIAKKTGYPYSTVQGHIKSWREGFSTLSLYQEYLAQKRGYKSLGDYYKEWAKERGYDSHWEYAKDAIKRKGYSSYAQYKRNLVEQNKKRPESKALSDLIKKRLVDLGETQFWLAHKINVSKITVSCYAGGRCLPRNEILIRIFFALEVPYRTLDDLLEETN